jgi:hypothetical protein
MLKTQFNENDFYFRSNFKGSSLQTGDCDLYFWFQLKLNNTCVLTETLFIIISTILVYNLVNLHITIYTVVTTEAVECGPNTASNPA